MCSFKVESFNASSSPAMREGLTPLQTGQDLEKNGVITRVWTRLRTDLVERLAIFYSTCIRQQSASALFNRASRLRDILCVTTTVDHVHSTKAVRALAALCVSISVIGKRVSIGSNSLPTARAVPVSLDNGTRRQVESGMYLCSQQHSLSETRFHARGRTVISLIIYVGPLHMQASTSSPTAKNDLLDKGTTRSTVHDWQIDSCSPCDRIHVHPSRLVAHRVNLG